MRDKPWACFFEKPVGHGKLQDSACAVLVDSNRLSNISERFLAIEGYFRGYVKFVDGMEAGAIMTLRSPSALKAS